MAKPGRPKVYKAEIIQKTISNNIKKKIAERGYSAGEVARHVGVTTSMVGRWLKAETMPGWVTLAKLCTLFREEPAYFLTVNKVKRAKPNKTTSSPEEMAAFLNDPVVFKKIASLHDALILDSVRRTNPYKDMPRTLFDEMDNKGTTTNDV